MQEGASLSARDTRSSMSKAGKEGSWERNRKEHSQISVHLQVRRSPLQALNFAKLVNKSCPLRLDQGCEALPTPRVQQ